MAKTETELPAPDEDRQLTLSEIIGHSAVRALLVESIAGGRLPQSILFAGPPGIGKKSLAYALIREVVARGEDPKTDRGSGKVARGTHPDVRVCEPARSVSGQIVIDTIRDADDWASTSPLEASKKFIVVTPAEAMNPNAANALLKLLEEPPRHLVIILTANDAANMLPTIRSRCTPFMLDSIPLDELVPWLVEKTRAPVEKARLAAELAEGRPGAAKAILSGDALEGRRAILRELDLLKTEGFAAVFGAADRLSALGPIAGTLATTLVLLRDSLSVRLDLDGVLNRDLIDEIRGFASGVSSEAILKAAQLVASASEEAGRYYIPQSQAHFMELLATSIGRELRRG